MENYTFADYEDTELDYENLPPLFGLSSTTWNGEPIYHITFSFDCDCNDEECNYCTK